MKTSIVVAIAALSMTAFAQTNTTTTTETAPAAQPVKKKSAQAKVKAKAKKEEAPAPVATGVSPSAEIKQGEAAPAITPAAQTNAAGVSTTQIEEKAVAKPLSATASVYVNTDESNAQYYQTLTKIGAGYKITPKVSLKVAQSFETLNQGNTITDQTEREYLKDSNFRASHANVTLGTSLPGMLGSKDMAASLNWTRMNGDAHYVKFGGYSTAESFIEANLSMPYAINPKVDVSVDSQWRHVQPRGNGAFANRFLVIPTASYTINETFSLYQSAGVIWSLSDAHELRRTAERMYLATGMGIAVNKNFNVDINVNQDKAYYIASQRGEKITPFTLYSANTVPGAPEKTFDAVGYEATATLSF